jgi:hypothetical protein
MAAQKKECSGEAPGKPLRATANRSLRLVVRSAAPCLTRLALLEKLLALQILILRVLSPLLAHHLVGKIIGVLENGQSSY